MVGLWASSLSSARDISVYVDSYIDTLDPHHTRTFAGHSVANTLHVGLLRYQSDGQLGPGLAQDWVISEDGLTYTFSLKPNLSWSDGGAVHAQDISAGIKRALSPVRPSPFAETLFAIENAEAYLSQTLSKGETLGISVLDASTLSIKLQRRSAGFLHVLAHPVSKPVPQGNPNVIAEGTVTASGYKVVRHLPTRLEIESLETGSHLVFEVVPSVDQAWQDATQAEAFVSAGLPMLAVPGGGAEALMVQPEGGESLYAYAFNMERAPFEQLEVRHALAMSVDRTKLLSGLEIDSAIPANQIVPPSAMTYDKSYGAPFAPLTVEERTAVAEALLSEHQIRPGDGFSINLRIPEGDMHLHIARDVVSMWSEIGIDANIVSAPLPEHWRALADGDFDVALTRWPTPRDMPRGFLAPMTRAAGPWNFSRYNFPDFDERLARADKGASKEDAAGHYREAEKALIEDQNLVALFFYRPFTFVSPNIAGWAANPIGLHPMAVLSVSQ